MGDARLYQPPNPKLQTPTKHQIPIPKPSVSSACRRELGSLEILWCLELGSWSFPQAQLPDPSQEGNRHAAPRLDAPLPGGVRGGFVRFHVRTLNSASRQDSLHHLAEVVREPEIASVVAVGQFLVVEPQQPQDRGVQVVHVYFVLDRARAKLICRAVNRAAFDAAAGEPDAERAI